MERERVSVMHDINNRAMTQTALFDGENDEALNSESCSPGSDSASLRRCSLELGFTPGCCLSLKLVRALFTAVISDDTFTITGDIFTGGHFTSRK